jgi:AcrR family transcriptional regulator
MAAAQQLFTERGYQDATIRDIAALARVSVGTVMAVGSKSALLVGLFDQKVLDILEQRDGQDLAGTSSSADPVEQVMALLDPFLRLFRRDQQLAREYGAELMRGEHPSGIFKLAERLKDEIAGVIRAHGDPVHPRDAADAVYLAYVGALFLIGTSPPDAHEGILEQLRSSIHLITEQRGS